MGPTRKDAVHRFFDYNESGNTSKCLLCEKELKGKHTTNLKSHLAIKHQDEYKVVDNINSDRQNARPPLNKRKLEDIVNICVKLVTIHGRPLAMMEDDAFQQLLNMAGSSIAESRPNIKSIKGSIIQEAANIRNKIWNEIKNSMVSLKIDSVTCAERKFIGVNIQYIKKSELIVRNLSITEVHNSQTGEYLTGKIEEILLDFKISKDQIYSICTDNGSNMIKMIKLIGGKYYIENEYDSDDYEDEYEQTDETNYNEMIVLGTSDNFKIRGMLCAAHTLQLAIKDAISNNNEAQDIINKSRNIVNILRKPNNTFRLKAANHNKPINDCRTRWTSTYKMLERLLTFRDISSTIPDILPLLLTDEFWSSIELLLYCLKPAYLATISLQRKNLTIGDFYIVWMECKTQLGNINNSIGLCLYEAMASRESTLLKNDVVLEAVYLDKRINLFLSTQQCEKAKKLLKETFTQMNKIKNVHQDEVRNDDSSATSSTVDISSGMLALEEMLQRAEQSRGPVRLMNMFEASLNEVCSERIPLTDNIINFWNKTSLNRSSELAMTANVVLAAPATQVSVERLFSSLKFILNPLRTNLNEFFLRDLMLVRENRDLLN